MRAKIAARAGGHPFEERFSKLTTEQLVILCHHAQQEEKREMQEKIEVMKAVSDLWTDNFTAFFDELKMFVNPKLFGALREFRQMAAYREEISEENFPEEWDRIKSMIAPEIIVNENPVSERDILPAISAEDERIFAGWVPYSETKE